MYSSQGKYINENVRRGSKSMFFRGAPVQRVIHYSEPMIKYTLRQHLNVASEIECKTNQQRGNHYCERL